MALYSLRDAKRHLVDKIIAIRADNYGHSPVLYRGPGDPLAQKLGIKIEEKKMDFDFGGYLPACHSSRPEPIIWLDTVASDGEHLNFTYFHEITHHLIREDSDLYSFLNEIANRNDDLDLLEERFANIGAAEFLIPSNEVARVLNEKGFSISLLPELDKLFSASKPAIAIQLAQCASHRCFVVVCEFGVPPENNKLQGQFVEAATVNSSRLYIRYSSNSPSQEKYSIARFVSLPQNHLLSAAFFSQQYVKGKDRIPFKSGHEWVVDCEALYYKGKVYAVFNTSPPAIISSLQPRLF